MKNLSNLKPAVPQSWLIGLAGSIWAGVGAMLCHLAIGWLQPVAAREKFLLFGLGIVLALAMYRTMFARLVSKNLARIETLPARGCLFAFQPWRSYILIVLMVMLGLAMRHSPIPRPILAVVYTTIGAALLMGAVQYWRKLL